eukprot:350964-Chlamydomonas_euryale.AAC.5
MSLGELGLSRDTSALRRSSPMPIAAAGAAADAAAAAAAADGLSSVLPSLLRCCCPCPAIASAAPHACAHGCRACACDTTVRVRHGMRHGVFAAASPGRSLGSQDTLCMRGPGGRLGPIDMRHTSKDRSALPLALRTPAVVPRQSEPRRRMILQ